MRTSVMYSQKIRHYSRIFQTTVDAYRAAVDFFISVCMEEWDVLSGIPNAKRQMNQLEAMTHPTAGRPAVPHCFDSAAFTMPVPAHAFCQTALSPDAVS